MVVLLQTSPNRFLSVQTKTLVKFFLNNSFFSVFGWKFFWRSATTLQRNCRKYFLFVQKTSWRNRFIRNSKCFWYILRLRAKFFLTSGRKSSPKVVKLLSTRSRSTFAWKISFLERFFSVWLPNFKQHCFWPSAKFLQKSCQNYSLRVWQKIEETVFFKKFLFFMYFRTSSETFFDFWKFLFANLSKLLFTILNELFDGK